MQTIDDLMDEAWQTAEDKGWHEGQRTFGDEIALMHSELSEALEAYRDGRGYLLWTSLRGGKPQGVPIELADCVIRILDCCRTHGIDLSDALQRKMRYNKRREHRHGGKVL